MRTPDLAELPWRPRPGPAERERLRTAAELGDLAALARFGWGPTDLATLGRRVLQASGGSGGLVPVALTIVAPYTVAHLAAPLAASGLRHGLLLRTAVVEHQDAATALLPAGTDAVLLLHDATLLPERVEDDAEAIAALRARLDATLARIAGETRAVVVIGTVPQGAGGGPDRRLVEDANRAITELTRERGAVLCDMAAFAATLGESAWHPGRFGHAARHGFAPAMAPFVADRIAGLIAPRFGRSRRVLVLDLDNTLWGGVVGDDGVDGIALSPGDPVGEAHRAVQRWALDLGRRGVLLAVSSKNGATIALEALRHPDMVLREGDLAALRVGWGAKPDNLRSLAAELNLGLDAFVVLDDDPAERALLRAALPDVLVPELPAHVSDWVPVLHAAGLFEGIGASAEDGVRRLDVQANAARVAAAVDVDPDAFLASLGMEVRIAPFDAAARPRIVQLLAKSNQFNPTTRRYAAPEIAAVEADPERIALTLRVSDRFADSGLVSVAIAAREGDAFRVEAWVMSCRVFGRRLEEAMLAALAAHAREGGARAIVGVYSPTARNGVVRDLFPRLGFAAAGEGRWRLELAGYAAPDLPMRTSGQSPR